MCKWCTVTIIRKIFNCSNQLDENVIKMSTYVLTVKMIEILKVNIYFISKLYTVKVKLRVGVVSGRDITRLPLNIFIFI